MKSSDLPAKFLVLVYVEFDLMYEIGESKSVQQSTHVARLDLRLYSNACLHMPSQEEGQHRPTAKVVRWSAAAITTTLAGRRWFRLQSCDHAFLEGWYGQLPDASWMCIFARRNFFLMPVVSREGWVLLWYCRVLIDSYSWQGIKGKEPQVRDMAHGMGHGHPLSTLHDWKPWGWSPWTAPSTMSMLPSAVVSPCCRTRCTRSRRDPGSRWNKSRALEVTMNALEEWEEENM